MELKLLKAFRTKWRRIMFLSSTHQSSCLGGSLVEIHMHHRSMVLYSFCSSYEFCFIYYYFLVFLFTVFFLAPAMPMNPKSKTNRFISELHLPAVPSLHAPIPNPIKDVSCIIRLGYFLWYVKLSYCSLLKLYFLFLRYIVCVVGRCHLRSIFRRKQNQKVVAWAWEN
jgi:hypothetical protein